MSWRNHSKLIEAKGVSAKKASSLGDLHRRRAETESQYFTPEWVAKGIWQSLLPVLEKAKQEGAETFTFLDNAIGSGRLLEGAPVESLYVHGLDVDPRCIEALTRDAEDAGIGYEFICGGMEDLDASHFNFSVINPPFSIHLESPNLQPYECNTFGRYGQATSATSHEYALEQALDAAHIVAAILPVSMDDYCRAKDDLNQIVYLPNNAFINEGANVATAVYFFAPRAGGAGINECSVTEGGEWAPLVTATNKLRHYAAPRFKMTGVDHSEPVITLPVTGNKRVELHHHNRQIVVKYRCGLVQSRVANGLLGEVADGVRLPKAIKYNGDGRFLLDVLLLQEQPEMQLERLASRINNLGGEAWISPSLEGFYKKLLKKHARAITPMYRAVKDTGVDLVQIQAKRRTLLEPGNFNSPSISKGEILEAVPNGGEYTVRYKDHSVVMRRDNLQERFSFVGGDDVSGGAEWVVKHEGLNHHFPELAKEHGARIDNEGIDWLAPFQRFSLIEGLLKPCGYIGAWEQGSGKARYALALALMHSGKNMIAVESGLMPEMLLEIEKLGIPSEKWKVLKTGDMPTAKINLVSYSTLRQGKRIRYNKTVTTRSETKEIPTVKVVRTNAELWRRQINVLVCDEGGLLSNLNTQQTRAVNKLAARKLIPLDGTPQRNYPRDLLPLSVASAGNGVAHQPYGVKGKAYIEPRLVDTASNSRRGEDVFYDNYVVTQWVTNEFREDLREGAKREVPKINNLSIFRDWLAPNIQRRLRAEPDLAIFNNCPTPERETFTVGWDGDHLGHYLKVATEFANWYKQDKGSSKALSLVTVLARIGAVQRAANSPHVESKSNFITYDPLTSKQRFALERINHWVEDGRKVILYAESPAVLKRLKIELDKQGVDSVLFTGQQDINKRAKALNDEFRYGKAQVLLSSWVGQRGLNLEQAGAVIFYERDWSATTEEQAIYRTQRPSQTLKVIVEYLHLHGSIDEYCAQLVEWKQLAADAGLDFGEQAGEDEEFLHMDTLLHRFCDEVLEMSVHDAKTALAS